MNRPTDQGSPQQLVEQIQQLRAALDGVQRQIDVLQSALSRAGVSIPPADSNWWKEAGVLEKSVATTPAGPPEKSPSYFGMEGAWVPGNVTEVDDLSEVLTSVDMEQTYKDQVRG